MLLAFESKQNYETVGKKLCQIPNVLEVHFVSGIYSFLIKFKVKNIDEYYAMSTKYVQQIPGVVRIEGFIATKTFKETDFIFL